MASPEYSKSNIIRKLGNQENSINILLILRQIPRLY